MKIFIIKNYDERNPHVCQIIPFFMTRHRSLTSNEIPTGHVNQYVMIMQFNFVFI